MAFTHKWSNQGLYVKFFDNLTSKDLIYSNSKMVGKAEYEKIKYLIIDFIDVTGSEVDDEDVNISIKFAIDADHYNPDLKVALISNNNDLKLLIEKFIKYSQLEIPHAQQNLFESISEAQPWITS